MDRFLRNLLTSSGEATPIDGEKTLSEIARTILVDNPNADPRDLREKAGLVALLNLLGILEVFYGERDAAKEAVEAKEPTQPQGRSESAPAKVEPPQEPKEMAPASPISAIASLMRLMASFQGREETNGGVANALTSLLENLDPAVIAGILGLISAMARGKQSSPKQEAQSGSEMPSEDRSGTGSGGEAPLGDALSPKAGGEGDASSAKSAQCLTGAETSAEKPDKPRGLATPNPPPSPLQQILGIDPKILTLILNVVADLMKPRLEPKEKAAPQGNPENEAASGPATRPQTESGSSSASQTRGSSREAMRGPEMSQPETTSLPGLKILEPRARKPLPSARPLHKPGLGIYKAPLGLADNRAQG